MRLLRALIVLIGVNYAFGKGESFWVNIICLVILSIICIYEGVFIVAIPIIVALLILTLAGGIDKLSDLIVFIKKKQS